MSEFERIPSNSHEIGESQHERIILALRELGFTLTDDSKALTCAFLAEEYGELALLFGYSHVIIGTEDDIVHIEVGHVPANGGARVDTHLYNLQERSLSSQTTIGYDNELLVELHALLDDLTAQAESYTNAAQEAYSMLIEGLRNTEDWKDFFAKYDALKETIEAMREEALVSEQPEERLYELDLQEMENDAVLIDNLAVLATKDLSVADLLKQYRYSIANSQAIEAHRVRLMVRITEEEEVEGPTVAGNPDDLIVLLDIASKLKNQGGF